MLRASLENKVELYGKKGEKSLYGTRLRAIVVS